MAFFWEKPEIFFFFGQLGLECMCKIELCLYQKLIYEGFKIFEIIPAEQIKKNIL